MTVAYPPAAVRAGRPAGAFAAPDAAPDGPHADAERLDARLGDPWSPENPFGFAAGAARDAAQEYPRQAEALLREEGFHLCHLPAALGGNLRSFEDCQILVRVCARRDVNFMPATMFSISALMTVLAAGTEDQHRLVADWLREGRTIAFGLSEERAGSDVLANTCRLTGEGTLHGSKWLVGRANTADAAVIVARTSERGAGAFTAVLLGPAELADPRVRRLPPQPTTGMRGIDFADLEFDGLAVPPHAVVGDVGSGLEGALRAQQIVRLMSTAGCLATADTALRTALRFARGHRTGGVPVADTPYGSRELALAAAELIATDLAVLVASRQVHLAPGAFGLASSVVKHVATRLTASSATRARAVVGARSVLRDGPGGVLDKAVRDNAMVAVIDTSVLGNLRALAMHLPAYAPAFADAAGPEAEAAADPGRERRLRALFALGERASLPELRAADLDLGVRPKDDVLLGFAAHAGEVAAELLRRGETRAAELVSGVRAALAAVTGSAAEAQRDRARSAKASPEPLDLADRLCLLHTAATAALAWWYHRDGRGLYGAAPGDAGWLTAVLALLAALADGRDPRTAAGPDLAPAGRLAAALDGAGLLFTALPVRLGDSRPADTADTAAEKNEKHEKHAKNEKKSTDDRNEEADPR
ncbi:alkylation response protein AidB-like acyl-CoA dehydrogenase [Streptomyces sp. 2132.2]|uniref:acyl-CoA dehydrogenase family protein n=1 Tax=Streptomyces sp. 2132.2 TaxID=2485161 RepID=UPI000F4A163F|nr:acyl-CoA dehydrogenase [Streptomyces sp. 2132.2]ROQ88903.1 alkylation response protein AidB-like acyl-CoA dehydrogenase [Streptomyces sp. 2132.2]